MAEGTDTPPAAPADRKAAAELTALARSLSSWLGRPRVRTCLVGLVLILLGAIFVTGSAWTFPLIVVGIAMIAVAWVGSRLEGRFAIEWGERGAGFELRARYRPLAPMLEVTQVTPPLAPPVPEPDVPDAVIEGEAHTVEIDVEELKALVAAAERLAAEDASAAAAPAPSPAEPFTGDASGEGLRAVGL